MDLIKSRKGQIFNQLQGLAIGLAILAIILAVAFLIMGNVQANDQVVANANASQAVAETMEATDDIPGWVPILVTVVIGGLIILAVRAFGGNR